MAYIAMVPESEATGDLAALYRRLAYPDGSVDEGFRILSLHPALLAADATMYHVLMHGSSPLPRHEREYLAMVVSRCNGCRPCFRHHAERRRKLRAALPRDAGPGEGREAALREFATTLTRTPATAGADAVAALRAVGLDDRAILDACSIVAYFNFANRITLGLGAVPANAPADRPPAPL